MCRGQRVCRCQAAGVSVALDTILRATGTSFSGSIRTVNHAVLTRSGISHYRNIMMMDMTRSLFRNIVRLIKDEQHSRSQQCRYHANDGRSYCESLSCTIFNINIIRYVHLKMYSVLAAYCQHSATFGRRFKINHRFVVCSLSGLSLSRTAVSNETLITKREIMKTTSKHAKSPGQRLLMRTVISFIKTSIPYVNCQRFEF